MEVKASRNGWMKRLAIAASALAIGAAATFGSAQAQNQPQNVRIAVGGTSFLDISYFFLLLPGPLGYWEEEGYKAEVFPISGSTEAAQQLAAGNIDFAQMASAVIIQANTEQQVPIRSLITNFTLGWGLAVKKDGPIKTIADLKGKNIGIVSLSSGGVPLVKTVAKNNGMNPDSDITLLATGVGAQPLLALQNDQVQALMYWSSALVGFQNRDPNLTIIKDPSWAKLPDFSFATIEKTIKEKPDMVEGISRGIAKAMVFAAANPDCARQLQWKFYPDTKPTGVDEATAARNDLAMISVLLQDQANATALNPGGLTAGVSAEAMGAYQDFLFGAGLIKQKVEPASLTVAEGKAFWDRVNDFDKAPIEAAAKACNF